MPRVMLTDRFCQHAKARPGDNRTSYFDEDTDGLELLAAKTGLRTWFCHFTSPRDGKRARWKLGTYPATSLGGARSRVLEAKACIEEIPPRDPRDVFAAKEADAMTVAALCESYLEKHARRLKRADNVEQRLRKNVIPIIGTVRLADLHRRDINRVIDAVMKRGRGTEANRNFETLRGMFNWAVGRGDLDRSPIEPRSKKPMVENGGRERFLSDDEIKHLWRALPDALAQSKACQRIVKLCLITGQRVGEVAGMRVDELDLKKRNWSLPGSRVKNASPHMVPLSDMAAEIVEDALADAGEGSEFVFPTEDRDGKSKAIDAHAVATTIRRALAPTKKLPRGRFDMKHWSAHALRHTVLTGMAALGVQPIVIGHVANHLTVTRAGITFSRYVHHTYEKEKRAALDLWAERVSAIVEGGAARVLPMAREAVIPA